VAKPTVGSTIVLVVVRKIESQEFSETLQFDSDDIVQEFLFLRHLTEIHERSLE